MGARSKNDDVQDGISLCPLLMPINMAKAETLEHAACFVSAS
jgi:hypothetical protein